MLQILIRRSCAFIVPIMLSLPSIAQNNLEYYIAAAKQNSPLINDNLNQSKANSFEVERLKAFYTKPQVGITANYLFAPIISNDNSKPSLELNPNGAENYYGYDMAASNGGTYQALLNISQPLFNSQRYKSASDVIKVSSMVSENNAKLSAHDLEKIVADQYILCIQDKMQLQYAEEMLTVLTDQKEIMKKLVENGIYKQSDLTLLNIEYQSFHSQQTTFKANYKRDLMDLNVLSGINDTSFVQLQTIELSLNTDAVNSAFLQKYQLDSLNLLAQQKFFELKYKPQVNLFANTGLNAVYAPTILNRFGLSAGISFSYIIGDGGQKNYNQEKINIQQKTIAFYRENFENQNRVRKNRIINELKSYSDRINIAQQQLKDYNTLLAAYRKEITSGQFSIINYITTLKSMTLIQRDYTLLFAQQQSLINAYNYWNW